MTPHNQHGKPTSPSNGSTGVRTQASVLTDVVRQDIIVGTLVPGSKLKLRELSERYKVGTIPLREALSRLAMSGFVEAEDQRGFRVARTSPEELLDIAWVRQRIESDALRDAIEYGDLNWESGVLAAFHRLSRIPIEVPGGSCGLNPEWEHAHEVFHLAMLSGCRSKWLLRLASTLREQSARYRYLAALSSESSERNVHQEHEAITTAVLARDADRACELLSVHLATTARQALAHATVNLAAQHTAERIAIGVQHLSEPRRASG
ncbi:FCD domain-containing protein [Azoarcus communis]|uniref:FCD domain-containing protein n=1 Tax=Parazoarcus communis TaxID=41977 RepID=UPI0014592405|nr:FCD domain-containing protein [Parazoarcus communis]